MTLKLISLNVWLGGKLMDQMLEFLKQENADIVVLQEVYNGHDKVREPRFRTMEILRQELQYPYDAFHAKFFDVYEGINTDQGNAVLSKFPIKSSRPIFFNQLYGEAKSDIATALEVPSGMIHACIDWPFDSAQGKELNVYGWHGMWGTDGRDNPQRLAMADMIVKEVINKPGIILVGDSNMNPDTESAARIGRVLTDVFGTSRTTSFNMLHKTNPAFATAVVDLLYISPDITVTKAECLDIDVSDHLPIMATIEKN